MKRYLYLLLVCSLVFICSCNLMNKLKYCTRNGKDDLTRSAKSYSHKTLLPIDCGIERNSVKTLNKDTPIADWVCRDTSEEIESNMSIPDTEWGRKLAIGNQKMLLSQREPTLLGDIPGLYEAYKFVVVIVGFDFSILHIIRIENSIKGKFIIRKTARDYRCDRHGEEKIAFDIDAKEISEQDWKEFKRIIEENSFWTAFAFDPGMVMEGDVWLLEGRQGEKYNILKKANISCEDKDPITNIGDIIYKLTSGKSFCSVNGLH